MEKLHFDSTVTLRNGMKMPVMGYSTEIHSENWRSQMDFFEEAIDAGFRYFSTSYMDRCLIPLRKAIEKSGIHRDAFFVSCSVPRRANANIAAYADEIAYDFAGPVDLLTMSWPYFMTMDLVWNGDPDLPKNANGFRISMQDLTEDLTRAIGVCNFDIHHLKELQKSPNFKIMPYTNENQFHPLYTCEELRLYCKENGIVFIQGTETNELVKVQNSTYATDVGKNGELWEVDERHEKANQLGIEMNRNGLRAYYEAEHPEQLKYLSTHSRNSEKSSTDPFDRDNNPREETDFYRHSKPLLAIGRKYGKDARQIINRWALQHGAVVLVKGIFRSEMEHAKDVFDFELTDKEMEKIDSYNMDKRFGYNPDFQDF